MLAGVTLVDPDTVYIDAQAQLSVDVTIKPNTHILGESRFGPRCEIGPNSVIADTEIGEDSHVVSSHTESASIGRRVGVGPFSRLRPDTVLADDVYIGNFAEVKNSRIGAGTRIGHHSYIGDAFVGKRVNIGAGTVTCNFDGAAKHRTVIGDEALIGSATMLVAPIEVGERARTGAGAVAISDIPADTTAVGSPARLVGERSTATESER
jgi:bifunctional UDP-N-acetylglucosamine pyrophosphorylase/glucosamine-1-phosphate N-acetyltransferase